MTYEVFLSCKHEVLWCRGFKNGTDTYQETYSSRQRLPRCFNDYLIKQFQTYLIRGMRNCWHLEKPMEVYFLSNCKKTNLVQKINSNVDQLSTESDQHWFWPDIVFRAYTLKLWFLINPGKYSKSPSLLKLQAVCFQVH